MLEPPIKVFTENFNHPLKKGDEAPRQQNNSIGASLTLNAVSAGYGGADVIKNISFSVQPGEKLAIIGPNGCGKTTLLRAIAGILPYSGEMLMDGRYAKDMKQRQIAEKVALLSQISGAYFSYSVYDTVMMGRYAHIKDRLLGMPSSLDRKKVQESLAAVGLWEEREREITELSGGQLQRVFLARTLAQEPKVLLLDEPTNHLDLKYQAELVEYLRNWAETSKCTVIGVFHDINLALQMEGNLLVMKEGRIRIIGKGPEIVAGGLLEEVYEMDVAEYMRKSLKIWEGIH